MAPRGGYWVRGPESALTLILGTQRHEVTLGLHHGKIVLRGLSPETSNKERTHGTIRSFATLTDVRGGAPSPRPLQYTQCLGQGFNPYGSEGPEPAQIPTLNATPNREPTPRPLRSSWAPDFSPITETYPSSSDHTLT